MDSYVDLGNVVTNFAVGFDVSDVCENCCAFAENVVLEDVFSCTVAILNVQRTSSARPETLAPTHSHPRTLTPSDAGESPESSDYTLNPIHPKLGLNHKP